MKCSKLFLDLSGDGIPGTILFSLDLAEDSSFQPCSQMLGKYSEDTAVYQGLESVEGYE